MGKITNSSSSSHTNLGLMNIDPHLKVGLIGNQANFFSEKLSSFSPRILNSPEDISSELDIVLCCSLNQIVKVDYLTKPKYGVFVIHSTDLPLGRGWAPLEWSVLHGLPEVTLTLFKAQEAVDSGPWILKESFPILATDTIYNLRLKDCNLALDMYKKLLQMIGAGERLILKEQKGAVSYWAKRSPENSELDAHKSILEQWDKIRVCDNEQYPAFFYFLGKKIYLRYEIAMNDEC